MKNGFYLLITLLFASTGYSQNIIPQPVSMKTDAGTFSITKKTTLIAKDAEDKKTAVLFNDYLRQVYGFKLGVNKPASKNYIRLSTLKFIKLLLNFSITRSSLIPLRLLGDKTGV